VKKFSKTNNKFQNYKQIIKFYNLFNVAGNFILKRYNYRQIPFSKLVLEIFKVENIENISYDIKNKKNSL